MEVDFRKGKRREGLREKYEMDCVGTTTYLNHMAKNGISLRNILQKIKTKRYHTFP